MLIQDLTNAWATRTKPAATWAWKPEIKWRKEVFKKFSEWDAPPFLGKTMERITEPFTIALWGITTELLQNYLTGSDTKPEDMTELRGISGSPGVVEGPARVLANHQEIDKLKEGEILVAALTSPSWGPIFTRMGGCVTDIGGMMSHAAIVCREYGTPAVVGTGFATKSIKTGDIIRVDGNQGIVTIVKRQGGV
jgi:pyruvate,water dikinase